MRVLVLGAAGMLGHKVCQVLASRYDTWGAVRSSVDHFRRFVILDADRIVPFVDAMCFDSVLGAVAQTSPDCIVNCVGIVKQIKAANEPLVSISVNALFPHRLAQLCRAHGMRLIHISTDCVFSGRKGNYVEDDVPDAEDLYGRTKCLGEVDAEGCLTLRTSIIGRELGTKHGLVEWFLSNNGGSVAGYREAIFSGLTTRSLANVIADLIQNDLHLHGVYHVSSEPISKYDLLCLLRETYRIPINIAPSSEVKVDRSLNCGRFRAVVGFVSPSWKSMLREMAEDPTQYAQ